MVHHHYHYLIIGGGMTAAGAIEGISSLDHTNKIGLITEERYPPYDRPPLTKGLWTGTPVESIWRKTGMENVILHLETTVSHVDVAKKVVHTTSGGTFSYNKLLLATGGRPRKLSCPNEGVIYFRTLDDYAHLRALFEKKEEFVVIGDGFIGTELAASLAMNGKKVSLIFRHPTIGSQRYPKSFSQFLSDYFQESGVKLYPQEEITSVSKNGERYRVTMKSGKVIESDGVVAGLGIEPNLELARNMGLKVEDGIVVDGTLQTSCEGIYAAGDVANFYSPTLGKRVRIEHENAANTMGKHAGINMTGKNEQYSYLPYFYSDLFDIGFEAIGELDSKLEMSEKWDELGRHGVVTYQKEGRVRGALLVGVWDQIDRMREIIAKEMVKA